MNPNNSLSRSLLFSISVLFSANAAFANNHAPVQKAHEHGVATMQFVIAGNNLMLEVHSPLYNLLGFEHKPKLEEQKQAVKQQLTAIKKGQLITLDKAAGCQLKAVHVEHPFQNSNHDHHHDHHHSHHDDDHADSNHSKHRDMSFEYELQCRDPKQLKTLNSQPLFSAWKNLQTLRVEWINQNRQSATNLNRDNTEIDLN